MKYLCLIFVSFILLATFCQAKSQQPFVDEENALSFIQDSTQHGERVKRFLYTSKEQQREAKEKYEEKCERSLWSRWLRKPRWCPHLETWPAWNLAIQGKLPNNNIEPGMDLPLKKK